MQYKKYRGKTFQEARLKLLMDLGSRAYIISHKKVKEGGFLGFFATPMIEITAGVLPEKLSSSHQEKSSLEEKTLSNMMQQSKGAMIRNETTTSEKNEIRLLKEEWSEMKGLMKRLIGNLTSSSSNSLESVLEGSKPSDDIQENRLENSLYEKNLELINMLLREDEFDEHFTQLIRSLPNIKKLCQQEVSLKQMKELLRKEIIQIIQMTGGIDLSQTKILTIVGPTGVGKTTTLAKLGASFGVFQKNKVQFISIDNYRVGAVEQLNLYASIMDIPLKRVSSVSEFANEINTSDADIILVDTTGRSQKNYGELLEIKKYLDVIQHKSMVALAVSATTKYKDLLEILDRFDTLDYDNLIVTKLDETNTVGEVLSAIQPKQCNLSYVTFGQSVPEDISESSEEKWMSNILKY